MDYILGPILAVSYNLSRVTSFVAGQPLFTPRNFVPHILTSHPTCSPKSYCFERSERSSCSDFGAARIRTQRKKSTTRWFFLWPFWDGENVTPSKVVGDFQWSGTKRSRLESPCNGSFVGFHAQKTAKNEDWDPLHSLWSIAIICVQNPHPKTVGSLYWHQPWPSLHIYFWGATPSFKNDQQHVFIKLWFSQKKLGNCNDPSRPTPTKKRNHDTDESRGNQLPADRLSKPSKKAKVTCKKRRGGFESTMLISMEWLKYNEAPDFFGLKKGGSLGLFDVLYL